MRAARVEVTRGVEAAEALAGVEETVPVRMEDTEAQAEIVLDRRWSGCVCTDVRCLGESHISQKRMH